MAWKDIPKELEAVLTHFSVELPYLGSEFEAVRRIAVFKPEKLESGRYLWVFPLSRIKDVEVALEGRVIEFGKKQLVSDVIPKCEPLAEEIRTSMERKGRGEVSVLVETDVYVVQWYERGELKDWRVSKSLVEYIWDAVISKMDLGSEGKKRSPWVAEHIVRALGEDGLDKHHWDIDDIDLSEDEGKDEREWDYINQGRWNHARSGNFNWKYFNGDRRHYFNLYYYPMKALQGLGLILFSRGGYITKIVENYDFERQKKMGEMVLLEKEMEGGRGRPVPGSAEDVNTWEFNADEDGQSRLFS